MATGVWGALSGLGKGMADVGRRSVEAALQREREARIQENTIARLRLQSELSQDNAAFSQGLRDASWRERNQITSRQQKERLRLQSELSQDNAAFSQGLQDASWRERHTITRQEQVEDREAKRRQAIELFKLKSATDHRNRLDELEYRHRLDIDRLWAAQDVEDDSWIWRHDIVRDEKLEDQRIPKAGEVVLRNGARWKMEDLRKAWEADNTIVDFDGNRVVKPGGESFERFLNRVAAPRYGISGALDGAAVSVGREVPGNGAASPRYRAAFERFVENNKDRGVPLSELKAVFDKRWNALYGRGKGKPEGGQEREKRKPFKTTGEAVFRVLGYPGDTKQVLRQIEEGTVSSWLSHGIDVFPWLEMAASDAGASDRRKILAYIRKLKMLEGRVDDGK